MDDLRLRSIHELTVERQAMLVAGSSAQDNCKCTSCSCSDDKNKLVTDLKNWGGPAAKANK